MWLFECFVKFSEKSVLLVARLHVDLCRLASVLCRA
ncbi:MULTISPECIES: putative leader peptide [Actinomadura]